MKEVFLIKDMPFHLIFFKGIDWLIFPCISYVHKDKAQCYGSEIVFGWLKYRISIYFHNGN